MSVRLITEKDIEDFYGYKTSPFLDVIGSQHLNKVIGKELWEYLIKHNEFFAELPKTTWISEPLRIFWDAGEIKAIRVVPLTLLHKFSEFDLSGKGLEEWIRENFEEYNEIVSEMLLDSLDKQLKNKFTVIARDIDDAINKIEDNGGSGEYVVIDNRYVLDIGDPEGYGVPRSGLAILRPPEIYIYGGEIYFVAFVNVFVRALRCAAKIDTSASNLKNK